jgi:hypothetical protein
MDRRKLSALTDLHRLSALKSDSELARLAAVAASRNRLRGAIDALRETEAPLGPAPAPGAQPAPPLDPALLGARLAHRRWIEAQQKRLNQQLALVTADYLRQKPAAARAFGRAKVLEQLGDRARVTLLQTRDRKARHGP